MIETEASNVIVYLQIANLSDVDQVAIVQTCCRSNLDYRDPWSAKDAFHFFLVIGVVEEPVSLYQKIKLRRMYTYQGAPKHHRLELNVQVRRISRTGHIVNSIL